LIRDVPVSADPEGEVERIGGAIPLVSLYRAEVGRVERELVGIQKAVGEGGCLRPESEARSTVLTAGGRSTDGAFAYFLVRVAELVAGVAAAPTLVSQLFSCEPSPVSNGNFSW
jgi:hypothetical protein